MQVFCKYTLLLLEGVMKEPCCSLIQEQKSAKLKA